MTAFYRAEVIGSLLRPAWLKQAREAWQAGLLATREFKRIEDRAVDEAIALQERAGLDVVTDGEMRRSHFIAPLTDTIEGVAVVPGFTRQWRKEAEGKQSTEQIRVQYAVVGKIRRKRSLMPEEFVYARARARKPLKVTLPSPMMMALRWSREHSAAAYPDPLGLFTDALDILREEVRELAALGCEYMQIDAPEIAMLCDEAVRREQFEAQGISPERMLTEGIEMINALADAPGIRFGLHMCRGNLSGHWLSVGGYQAISQRVFGRATRYEIFLLEYDDWRSGSFEPLADVPKDKRVVLGLVSTKRGDLEPADGITARIEEAARFFTRDQLALSTQCGFASVMAGNPITEAAQEAKLRLVAEVAHRVWRQP